MSAAAPAPMLDSELHLELWRSFVALLRSYAALHHPQPAQVEASENTAAILAGAGRLTMQFDPATGAVRWQQHLPPHAAVTGSFIIQPEGTISIDGSTRDLDHAAIDFIDFVLKGHGFSRADKGPEREGASAPERISPKVKGEKP